MSLFGRSTELMTDGKIYSEIRETIATARSTLIICSPYVDPTDDYIRQVEAAVRDRKVAVTLYFREDKLGEYRGADWFKRFRDVGVALKVVDRLHSKLYINEDSALVTSMNFTRYSGENSLEAGVIFDATGGLGDQIQQYLNFLAQNAKDAAGERPGKPASSPRSSAPRERRPEPQGAPEGHCIGCGASIPAQKDRPFCRDCYPGWDKSKSSPQKRCFGCGKAARVTFERPLCLDCFRAQW